MSAYFSATANTYLYCTAAAPATLPATQSLTLMCWVKLGTNPSASRAILGAAPAFGAGYFGIETNTDGLTPGLSVGTSSFYSPYALQSSTWYHVCASIKSATTSSHLTQFYVNGVQVLANQNNTTLFAAAYASFTCGSLSTGYSTAQLVGWVQDVRIFTRVLTPKEVQIEMHAQFPVRPGLFLHSDFYNDVRQDQSGVGHLWTLNGAGAVLAANMQPKSVPRRSSRIFL
jgi:hypothetical protein